MDKINKLSLPVVILIASIILGGFFYASQVNKQKSIEKQQEIKMADDRRVEEAKAEQTKKEYVAKRKNECYSLYEKERSKWNNTKGSEYDEEKDVCLVRYKATDEWKGKKCDDFLPKADTGEFLRKLLLKSYFDCQDNSFTNEF